MSRAEKLKDEIGNVTSTYKNQKNFDWGEVDSNYEQLFECRSFPGFLFFFFKPKL